MCAELGRAQSWDRRSQSWDGRVRRAGTAVRRAGAAVRWAQCVRDGAFTGPTRLGLLKLSEGVVVVSVQARVEYIALELGEVEVVGVILLSCVVVQVDPGLLPYYPLLPWVVAHEGVGAKARGLRRRGGEEGYRCHGESQGHLPEVQQNTSQSVKQSGR